MHAHAAYRRNFGPENLVELSKNMIIQHEDYLKQDDPDRKADALRYMAGYATQYLHLVPQEKKFTFKETERLLHNSAMNIAEFDPREGSLAFTNLAKYAENLLEQPWRQDFHIIKLTSGFYVHNVAAQLQNAHEILIVMGYVNIDDTTLKLLPNQNYSNLKAVSRDCYIASQECLILSQIWQHVADQEPDYPLTIGEVFEYRKNHLGDTDTICNKLLYDIRQRMHLVKQQQQKQHQLTLQQHQQPPATISKAPQSQHQHQRFVPVDRLIDYGVDDVMNVDEPDLLPSRGFAPEREVDHSQEMLKNLNMNHYQDDEHIYDPVYGSNNDLHQPIPSHFPPQKQRERERTRQIPPVYNHNPNNLQGGHAQAPQQGQYFYNRKSMPASSNYNTYQQPLAPQASQQYHNNFNSNGATNNIMMMYGDRDPHSQRNQSMSPMIPQTVASLFSNNTTPPNNRIHTSNSRNNVSKSNSMNSIRATGAASSSSSSSISQNFPLSKTKIKETDLDAEFGQTPASPSRESNLMQQYHLNNVLPVRTQSNHNHGSVRARKTMPPSAFSNNFQQQQHQGQLTSSVNNQVYPDEFYPPGIVKPVAVYGSSTIPNNSGNSGPSLPGQSTLGSNFQYYMRARQNSDNSEDVLNEAYAYASEVNQIPKGRVSSSTSVKSEPYQHQATPIPLPQGSDSDSHSGEGRLRASNSNPAQRESGLGVGVGQGPARSGSSSTDASSSWGEGSVREREGNYSKGRSQTQTQIATENHVVKARKSEPVRRPTHIDIRSSASGINGRAQAQTQSEQVAKMRYADSSPESDVLRSQQQQQPGRNNNGYRELSSSSSAGSPASGSSRNFPRNEELNSLDTVYYDYLLKKGDSDEVLGRDGNNEVGVGGSENDRNSNHSTRERKSRSSKVSSHGQHQNHLQNNYGSEPPEENHMYDGRRVIPKKKQQNLPSSDGGSLLRKRQNPQEGTEPSVGSRMDPNYNNLITAEISKPSLEKNMRRSESQSRTRTPVESDLPPGSPSPPPQPKKPVEPWDCRFCTFRNVVEERICEICAKSKDFYEEEDSPISPPLSGRDPPPSASASVPGAGSMPKLYSVAAGSSNIAGVGLGGVVQPSTSSAVGASSSSGYVAGAVISSLEETPEEVECPQCTLLNPVRARVCDACNFRLKPVESPKTLEQNQYDIR